MTNIDRRNLRLKRILSERRRELCDGLESGLREGRTSRPADVRDTIEVSDDDVQGELGFALIQITAETVSRIDDALVRLAAGTYGSCAACGSEIDDRRLRALPFAVRCRSCEARREDGQRRARQGLRQPTFETVLETAAPDGGYLR